MKQFCKVRLTFIFYDVILVAKLALHDLGGTVEHKNQRAPKGEKDISGTACARRRYHATDDHVHRGGKIYGIACVGV